MGSISSLQNRMKATLASISLELKSWAELGALTCKRVRILWKKSATNQNKLCSSFSRYGNGNRASVLNGSFV